eukprot:TRINITY_DN10165_c0_g1_i1.p1 TRINITY_DN10165_c0_g1~~TRINITY_DN10165_c0_g1_i1.p1  ORF type:complete len:203 (-),score=33.32 TRINITY_DN10165_c0_g1_i1:230-838(-)
MKKLALIGLIDAFNCGLWPLFLLICIVVTVVGVGVASVTHTSDEFKKGDFTLIPGYMNRQLLATSSTSNQTTALGIEIWGINIFAIITIGFSVLIMIIGIFGCCIYVYCFRDIIPSESYEEELTSTVSEYYSTTNATFSSFDDLLTKTQSNSEESNHWISCDTSTDIEISVPTISNETSEPLPTSSRSWISDDSEGSTFSSF